MITGGGAMHLNDSFGRNKKIQCIFHHHEQACAIAAEGYARLSGKLAVVNVTTGPGGLNTLTGVMGQWTDSIPVLYLSGQVKYETTVGSCPAVRLRQLGDQEVNIIDVVKPLTKFAAVLKDPTDVKKILQEAIHCATHSRPGPVWIDIPMDVQGAMIEPGALEGFRENKTGSFFRCNPDNRQINQVLALLKKAERPLLLAGYGIRISNALTDINELLPKLKIPVAGTFNGFDIIETGNPFFIGRVGTIGNRSGNFVLQNADLLIEIGSRNNIRQISYAWRFFARSAKKVVVDIDEAELQKPTVRPDIAIHADAKQFILALQAHVAKVTLPDWKPWLDWCKEKKDKYFDMPRGDILGMREINPYDFTRTLSRLLPEHAIVVTSNATPSIAYFQNGWVKKGQRVLWNSGCASMGYELPAAIGACIANSKKDVICLAGDGSLQMNIQELMTVSYLRLPLKIFYFNNGGYVSIKNTQDSFFGRRMGTDERTGIGFPDIIKIAKAYGLLTDRIKRTEELPDKIEKVLGSKGPILCEVVLQREYEFQPKLSSYKKPDGTIISKPLEDMYPFLKREEFKRNMIIPPLPEA